MKRFKLLDGNAIPGDSPNETVGQLRWDLCLLCQALKNEVLQCPNDSKRPDNGIGYISLADILQQFSVQGELPSWLNLAKLDEGAGIAATFSTHCAKWHKSCRNSYTKIKLERLCKRKLQADDGNDDVANPTERPVCSTDVVAENVERSTRSSSSLTSSDVNLRCLFCDKCTDGPLHQVTTFDVDCRVRKCANTLQDSKLLAKLSAGDLIALEARYHARCLVALYNRAAAVDRETSSSEPTHSCSESLAFAQLVEYISELKRDCSIAPVFKLSDLTKMFQCRLPPETRVHSTRLKNRLLSQFPGMTAQSHGKEVLLVFDEDIAGALSNACQFDADVEASILVKAAHIVRRDIANVTYKFSGEFLPNCQEVSVPQSLTALTQMILEGASIDSHTDMTCVPAAQSIAQLIVFNSVKHTRKSAVTQSVPVAKIRHNISRETPLRTRPAQNSKLAAIRNDCSLFSRLYIACQTRSGDLDSFFAHENQPAPPSLSNDGNLRFGAKSDLLPCLEGLVTSHQECPAVDALVLDGAAIVQMLQPFQCKTFADYACKIFVPYVKSQLHKVTRLDVVFDQYLTDSLKAATRSKRGSGMRRKVVPSGELPRNWSEFLHCDENKTELFHFLSSYVSAMELSETKQLVVTVGSHVLSCNMNSCTELDPCSHEEADTRMLLHVAHAAENGHAKIMILTVDIDVVVIAIASLHHLPKISELWLAFGTGKKFRYISIHEIVDSLGDERSRSLPFFHAFTGCDTVSSFNGRGKKTAWDVWNAFPAVSDTFKQLSSQPTEVQVQCMMPMIQRFVVLLYDRSSCKMTVNALRKHLFTKKCRTMERIPPT